MSSSRYKLTCAECGNTWHGYGKLDGKTFCSYQCSLIHKRKSEEIDCEVNDVKGDLLKIIEEMFNVEGTTYDSSIQRFAGFLDNVNKYLNCCSLHNDKLTELANKIKELKA